MPTVNLNNGEVIMGGSKTDVAIVHKLADLPGGRALDTTGFTNEVIKSGHVIIRETATDVYKPMPISGDAYAALPSGHEFFGVLDGTILTAKPAAAIMVEGTVNDLASPYPPTDAMRDWTRWGIVFLHDNAQMA